MPKEGDEETEDNAGKFANKDALNRWTLSEDPNDRKDGLWIWGLFEVRTHYLT